jgi:hypothetical protein
MERKTSKCEALQIFLEANATSKEKMAKWESLTVVRTKEYLLVTQV